MMKNEEKAVDKYSKILEAWGKYIGFLLAVGGLVNLIASNDAVALVLLTVGGFLLEIWLWYVWHQGEYIKDAILHGKPLPSIIYSENQRRTAKLTSILILIVYVILLMVFARKSYQFAASILAPTPTLTQAATTTLTPSQTPTFTPTPATSTLTPTTAFTFTQMPSSTSTFTPSPMPTITFTSTQTHDPIIFKGFDRNCIDPAYWTTHVYPGEATSEPSSCLDLSARGFNSQDGGLRISINNVPYSVFSMSTELPNKDLEIHFKINFDSFISKSSDTAAVLVFGVGPTDDWILKNGYYLSYSILQGSATNEILEQTGTNKLKPDYLLHKFFSPKKIDVRIVIKGIEVTMYIDNTTYGFFPVSLSKPGSRDNFWMGYQLPANQSTLKATISEFTITEK